MHTKLGPTTVRGTLALAVGAALLCGCGKPSGGDPGDARLRELAADRVFASLPAGARSRAVVRTPARHAQTGFASGGWHGPSVIATFSWSGPPRPVFRFFARRAAATGWRATAAGALHVTDRWAKSYPDGASATLLLSWLPATHTFRLAGSISLPN